MYMPSYLTDKQIIEEHNRTQTNKAESVDVIIMMNDSKRKKYEACRNAFKKQNNTLGLRQGTDFI